MEMRLGRVLSSSRVYLQQGAFPDEVQAPVQYGARFKAAVVYLTEYHMLPAKRTGELLEAWCGTPPSTGIVMNLIEQGLVTAWKLLTELWPKPCCASQLSGRTRRGLGGGTSALAACTRQ